MSLLVAIVYETLLKNEVKNTYVTAPVYPVGDISRASICSVASYMVSSCEVASHDWPQL